MDVVTSRVTLQDLAIYNMTPYNGSQAETIYTYGSNLNLIRVGLYSYQDTLLANAGSLFVTDSYIEGNVDYMWGTAATYFQRCELKANTNNGSAVAGYTQARNASNGYGFSYVNCTLDAYPGVTNNSYSLSRSFANSYPFTQTAYINCRMGPHIVPAGWQLYDGTGLTSQLWEYQSRDLSNNLLSSSVLTNRPTYNRSFSLSGTNIVYTSGQTNSPDVLTNGQISAALAAVMTNSTQILGWTPTASPDASITPISNAVTIYQGSVFTDPGATVVDPADGTVSIPSGSGSVNTSALGSYTVTYGYTNSLKIPATPATMTVTVEAIPTALISFSGTNVPYNGNPRPVTVTTTPSNVAVDVTYNGSATAPTAVGTYAVNANVTASNYQGSNSSTLTIYDASANWRQAFYGTTSNSGNAADSADPYGTGMSNLQNYTLGNNPTLPATNPLGNTMSSNGLFSLSFTAVPAGNGAGYAGLTRYYALESSTNPAGPVWSSITGYSSIAASNQTVNFSTNTTISTNWFVRIRAWLQ
jgi:pectin methylesterase-like acyl-CoA thioesterase